VSSKVTKSRITRRFAKLKEQNRAALVPFITANDPNADVFGQILEGLPAAGADLIELGMPFSDPMADGPSVQLSSQRALKAGVTLQGVLDTVAAMREWEMDTPIILMGYYNPIYRYGPEEFAKAAAEAGVDGLIVVDLPPEEAEELNQHLRDNGLHMIFLAAPTTDTTRLPRVLEHASGFLYYVAVKGVTGTKSADMVQVGAAVAAIRKETNLPIGVGFGIRTAEQAAEMAAFADATVVGSAIVDIITDGLNDNSEADAGLSARVLDFVKTLSDGVRGARASAMTQAASGGGS
jgi:tryptophan synthase alpha chain